MISNVCTGGFVREAALSPQTGRMLCVTSCHSSFGPHTTHTPGEVAAALRNVAPYACSAGGALLAVSHQVISRPEGRIMLGAC